MPTPRMFTAIGKQKATRAIGTQQAPTDTDWILAVVTKVTGAIDSTYQVRLQGGSEVGAASVLDTPIAVGDTVYCSRIEGMGSVLIVGYGNSVGGL